MPGRQRHDPRYTSELLVKTPTTGTNHSIGYWQLGYQTELELYSFAP